MRGTLICLFVVTAACSGPAAEGSAPQSPVARETLARARTAAAAKAAAQEKLHSHMQRITEEVFGLVESHGEPGATADRRRVLQHLDRIIAEARATSRLGLRDPSYVDNIEGFIREVGFVRQAVVENASDLNIHGSVMGACVYCHELRGCRGRDGTCPDVNGL